MHINKSTLQNMQIVTKTSLFILCGNLNKTENNSNLQPIQKLKKNAISKRVKNFQLSCLSAKEIMETENMEYG
jgi:hypothetical protein